MQALITSGRKDGRDNSGEENGAYRLMWGWW